MLSLDDERWSGLEGGYRIKFDPRPLLLRLEAGRDVDAVWHELWGELHHQGDGDVVDGRIDQALQKVSGLAFSANSTQAARGEA